MWKVFQAKNEMCSDQWVIENDIQLSDSESYRFETLTSSNSQPGGAYRSLEGLVGYKRYHSIINEPSWTT